ncbi:hypothetical protein [Tuwongella immobilis]|uniref:Uncharacterized protein n=1 Tax=Tuwongella immobilis TaxID=692036 RepID=A0A6C2YGR7_9BACT|nr:hypothetical protein [Tuwongella immobilis]VIP00686.1 unnamed protein product [Tuwongella immobilis]VTR96790.1 unnamed protein product [Tuwongella immobilis]
MNWNDAVPMPFAVYRPPNMPPSPADLTGSGRILEMYERGQLFRPTVLVPSHALLVPLMTDIRDGTGELGGTGGDLLFVPDSGGSQFVVLAVVRHRGQRLCYLKRSSRPSGPFIPV